MAERRDAYETYASPGLRWALCVEDHPDAAIGFVEALGSEVGISPEYGGNLLGVLASIVFDDKVHQGWKEFEGNKKDPETWEKCCTKAQGRALKRAGYPADTSDLKLLVLWRQRAAEIARLGTPRDSDLERAIDAAAVADPDHDADEEVDAPCIDPQELGQPEQQDTQREEDAPRPSTSSATTGHTDEPHREIDGGGGSEQSPGGNGADPQPSLDDVVGPRDALAVRIRALPDDKRTLYLRDRKNHVPPLPAVNVCDDLQLAQLTQIVAFYEQQVTEQHAEATA